MGAVFWSSPYRLQVAVICLGLLLLTAAFVLLLLSIGLGDFHWRLAGGVCASTGSACLVVGACWCVWVVRRGRFIVVQTTSGGNSAGNENEATQTLTSDSTWREEAGLEAGGIDGPCSAAHIDEHIIDDLEDDTDDSDIDDSDIDDDDDMDEEDEEEEEEEDCLGPEIYPVERGYKSRNRQHERTGLFGTKRGPRIEDTNNVETKEEESSRLIPV